MSPYETHKPVLEYFIDQYNTNVLELGCGNSSTDLIIEKSSQSLSLEDNKEWFSKVVGKARENHKVEFVEPGSWREKLNSLLPCYFDLIFIDNGVFSDRCLALEIFKDSSKVVLMHDSFNEHLNRCNINIRSLYSNMINFYPNEKRQAEYPPTIALSNFVDLSNIKIGEYISEIY